MTKKLFKVLTHVDKPGGGGFWMRVGTASVNKDDSINVWLDAMPKSFELHLRELGEEDLRKRDSSGSRHDASPASIMPLPLPSAPLAADQVPF